MCQIKVNDPRDGGSCGERLGLREPLYVLLDEVSESLQTCCTLAPVELRPWTFTKGFFCYGDSAVHVLPACDWEVVDHNRVVHRVKQCQPRFGSVEAISVLIPPICQLVFGDTTARHYIIDVPHFLDKTFVEVAELLYLSF